MKIRGAKISMENLRGAKMSMEVFKGCENIRRKIKGYEKFSLFSENPPTGYPDLKKTGP